LISCITVLWNYYKEKTLKNVYKTFIGMKAA